MNGCYFNINYRSCTSGVHPSVCLSVSLSVPSIAAALRSVSVAGARAQRQLCRSQGAGSRAGSRYLRAPKHSSEWATSML